jgi:hypothetical protein
MHQFDITTSQETQKVWLCRRNPKISAFSFVIMKSPIFQSHACWFPISLLSSGLGLQSEALAGAALKLYYEENAQVELISPESPRILPERFGLIWRKLILTNIENLSYI